MNRSLLILLLLVPCMSFRQPVAGYKNPSEARKAFVYLNQIRQQPEKYAAALHLPTGLAVTRTRLLWNDTLAKVATAKAADMAARNYFGHVDPEGFGINHFIHAAGYALEPEWTVKPSINLFESVVAGADSGEEGIRQLIQDASDPNLGHRKHLLGMGSWYSPMVDVGIGYVTSTGTTYGSYMCVIIARHKW